MDFCPTGALQFGEADDLDLAGAVPSKPGSRLYYKNMPKRRICGTVADRTINEVLIGAKVRQVGGRAGWGGWGHPHVSPDSLSSSGAGRRECRGYGD